MSYPISQASSVLSFPSERSFVRRLEYRANLDHAEELERAFPIFTFVPSATTTTHFFPSNSSLSSSFFLSFSFFSFFSTAALRQESREKRGKRIISDRKNNGGCNHRNYTIIISRARYRCYDISVDSVKFCRPLMPQPAEKESLPKAWIRSNGYRSTNQ